MKNMFIGISLLLATACFGQTIPDSALYLGQTPPANIPKIFGPGLLASSGHFAAERITVSSDGMGIYYSEVNAYPITSSRVKYFKYSENKWNGPFILFQNYNSPAFSPQDSMLLFQTSQQEAWYSVNNDTGWSAPSRFWNSSHRQHYLQVVNTGNYYLTSDPVISSNGDICELLVRGSDTTVQSLGVPVNSVNNGMDYFIAKDESFIIRVIRSNGIGDLFISYHKTDGSWTNPKTLGTQVNSSQGWEWGPYVTNDNKYLFFTRQISATDIYWVRVANLIDSLKRTNFIPYLKNPLPDQALIKNCRFHFQIPDTVFIDDDGNNTLTYSSTLSNGSPLPAWISFDSTTRTFSGTPSAAGTYSVKVTAKDTANASSSVILKLTVSLPVIDYFGQTPPGDTAKIFAPGIVSKSGRFEHAAIFSQDGKEFYFSITPSDWVFRSTVIRKYSNNSWTEEEVSSFSSRHIGGECTISYTNDSLIYTDGTDLWMVTRNDSGWSEPDKLPNAINSFDVQWHPTITINGDIFFSSRGSIYKSAKSNNEYQIPMKLPAPINTSNLNADAVIAPDGSYIIFNSTRAGGYGDVDLYICYLKKDGGWTDPVNLGPDINSEKFDDASSVSPDGKYFFFSRRTNSECDIYWVSAGFIDSIKQIVAGVRQASVETPSQFNLFPNYPNPFNPSTMIRYSIGSSSHVTLTIYNLLGQKIRTVIDSFHAVGEYSAVWDATDETNNPVSSGVYFYRFETNNRTLQRKMVLLR